MGNESAARPDNLRQYARAINGAADDLRVAAAVVEQAQGAWERTGPAFGRTTGSAATTAQGSARRWQDLAASVDRVASAFVRADQAGNGGLLGQTLERRSPALVTVTTTSLFPYLGALLPADGFSRLSTAQRVARAEADAQRLQRSSRTIGDDGHRLAAALDGIRPEEVQDPVYAATLLNRLGASGLDRVIDALSTLHSADPANRPQAHRNLSRLATAFAVATHTLPDPADPEDPSVVTLDQRLVDQLLRQPLHAPTLNALLIDPSVEPRADIVARAAVQLLVSRPSEQRLDDPQVDRFLGSMAGDVDVDRPVLERLAAAPVAATQFFTLDPRSLRAVLGLKNNDRLAAQVARTGLITAADQPEWGYRLDRANAAVVYLAGHAPTDQRGQFLAADQSRVGPLGKVVMADLVGAYPDLFADMARGLMDGGSRPVTNEDIRRYDQVVASDPVAARRLMAVIGSLGQAALPVRVDAVASSATSSGSLNAQAVGPVADRLGALAGQFEMAIRRDRTHHSELLALWYTVLGHTKELAAFGVAAAPLTAGQSAVLAPLSAHLIDALIEKMKRDHPADVKGTSADVRRELELAFKVQVSAALLSDARIAATVTSEGSGGHRFFDLSTRRFLPPGPEDGAPFQDWLESNITLGAVVTDYASKFKASWDHAQTAD